MFIKQKNADVIVVNTTGYENNLWLHPAMVKHSDKFEIVENLPSNYTRLIYCDSDLEIQIEVNL